MIADILIAVAVVAAVDAALAALLVIADKYMADYGECTITINKERRLGVTGGGSLMSALMAQSIFIPSACGGRATCALCKLKVPAGGGPVLPTETPFLTEAELKENVRLSCQVKVRNDLEVEIPQDLFSVRQYDARLTQLRDLTYDTKEFVFTLEGADRMDFVPGQYVQFEIPAYNDVPEPIYRAYSMASTPSELPNVRFIVRRAPNGIAATYLFDHLKQGQTLRFNGPHGEFRLTDRAGKAVFVAGGVGMSAIYALVRQLHEQRSQRPVDFFFGVNTPRDLFYLDEVKALAKDLLSLRFIPGLARKEDTDHWDGEVGLVTEILDRHIRPGEAEEAYLCGGPGMVDACLKLLHTKGIGSERTYFDKFT